MAARRTETRTPQIKQQATAQLEAGETTFTLDVTGLAMRERNKIRMHVNRWMRERGLYGKTRYVYDDKQLLHCWVLGKREDT